MQFVASGLHLRGDARGRHGLFSQKSAVTPRDFMRTFLRAALSFLAGLVVTYVVAVAAMLSFMSVRNVFDRDGGMTMAVMFAIGPLCAIIGGIAAAIVIPIWLGRRDLARAAAGIPPKKRWPTKRRAAVAAILSGVSTYFLASVLLPLFAGTSFDSYAAALAVSLTPLVLGAGAAALAALLVLRGARPQTA